VIVPFDVHPWRRDAACASTDVATFFPIGDLVGDWETPLGLCRRCPVRDECLEFALVSGQRDGVWGGTTPAERQRLRSCLRPATDGTKLTARRLGKAERVVRRLQLAVGRDVVAEEASRV
jgi:WhiB family redox-sensing transcriptional regulator